MTWRHFAAVFSLGITVALGGSNTQVAASAGGPAADPSCSSANPCIIYSNTGTGPGLKSTSAHGSGLVGATANTSASVSAAGSVGVDSQATTKTNNGVLGMSTRGNGVKGQSTHGTGVFGLGSGSGSIGVVGSGASFGAQFLGPADGVFAETNNNTSTQFAALVGLDNFTANATDPNVGVLGESNTGVAVQGNTASGIGLQSIVTSSGNGVEVGVNTGDGVLVDSAGTGGPGIAVSTAASTAGEALLGEANGEGVVAEGFSTTTPALRALCSNASGGIAIIASFFASDLMSLDCAGNMILKGTLTASGTPLAITHASTGAAVDSYMPRQSLPTMEDFGDAQLVDGQAYVRLEPRFAAVIDRNASYLVFITPEGDTNGLYVTGKSSAGFEVRENRGGRSTVDFAYRIVAKPYDAAAIRFPAARVLPQHDASSASLADSALQAKVDARTFLRRSASRASEQDTVLQTQARSANTNSSSQNGSAPN